MLTNIDIDEDLIAKVMQLSGARSKREAVDRALRDMLARAQRPRVRDVWGRATDQTYWPDYDPKTEPGEPAGRYRVEQPLAGYKLAPRAQAVAQPSTPTPKPPRRKK
jgi:hypothetical protein